MNVQYYPKDIPIGSEDTGFWAIRIFCPLPLKRCVIASPIANLFRGNGRKNR